MFDIARPLRLKMDGCLGIKLMFNVFSKVSNRCSFAVAQIENRPANIFAVREKHQRIDDIFGYVRKHVPPLWQYPYRIGINNQEAEVMLLCVGRGKYDIDLQQVYDGDTGPNTGLTVFINCINVAITDRCKVDIVWCVNILYA